MFGIENYIGFVGAVLLFQAIPGPGTVAILAATARGGVRGGVGAVLGTLAGDFAYMLAAVLGLAAVLAAYPSVLAAAQWLGIGYLGWLGVGLLREAAGAATPQAAATRRPGAAFRQAFAVSLTNPKVLLFFLAFFPLFLGADPGPVTLVALMTHVTVLSGLYQLGLVFAGRAVARRLARWPAADRVARRLAGVALIGFGVRLALDGR